MPPAAAPAQAAPQAWLDLYRQAALGDPRPLRNRWLAELGQAADRYLRSGAFLTLMEIQARSLRRSMSWFSPPRR